jgi:hypothetical protein
MIQSINLSSSRTHEEDPALSVVVFEADSASICVSSSIDGEGKRKRC